MKPFAMSADERRAGHVIAIGSMIFFLAYWRPWEGGSRLGLFAIGFVLALALLACVRWGNRVAGSTAAFCLAIFGSWPTLLHYVVAWVIGLAYAAWVALAMVRPRERT